MRKIILSIFVISLFGSCKKYLEPGSPGTQLSSEAVFDNDVTATAAQVAIYSQMEGMGLFYSLTLYPGLSADELTNHSWLTDQTEISVNNVAPPNFHVKQIWTDLYRFIYQANAILERTASGKLSEATKKQLRGESLFVRALCHFFLVNLYGSVPLIRTTNYELNNSPGQATADSVYLSVESDLIEARGLLSENYVTAAGTVTNERVRPNKWAATALLARVYLYRQRWADAETLATEVIGAGKYQLVNNLDNVFLKNSAEAIWQLMAVIPGYNSHAGGSFILNTIPYVSSVSSSFMDSYREGDLRKTAWIGAFTEDGMTYYYPYKYKVPQNVPTVSEYTMALRLGEQLLIRAEARAMQDNLPGAEFDLNLIRQRAGLLPVSGLVKQTLLDSIYTERRFELAFESGDRWLDLKRTSKVNEVLAVVKGADWTSTDALYPIPFNEMSRNPQLKQNPGY